MQRTDGLLRDPDYRAALRTQHRLSLQRTYADVGTMLKAFSDMIDQQIASVKAQQRVMETQNAIEPAGGAFGIALPMRSSANVLASQ